MSTPLRRIAALCASVSALLFGLTAPAAAAPLEHGTDHLTGSNFFEDCGVDVRLDFDVTLHFKFGPQGPDGMFYGMQNVQGTSEETNLSTGKSLTHVFRVTEKDLRVTDNGDGTLTILVMATGSDKWYGPDGEYLFNDAGQIRYEILIDHAGTPDDPFDDVFLADLGLVKGSTGRNDTQDRDFCEDFLALTS